MIFLLCRVVDVFYLLSVDTSWRAIWHYRPLDRCRSRSVRADWHSRGVHLPFWKKYLAGVFLHFHQSSCLCTEEDLCLFFDSNFFWFFCVCCLSYDIVEKRSQLEYANVELIRMPPVQSNVSTTTELWVMNSRFHRFLKLCGCNGLSHGRSCCFLKAKGHPSEVFLKFNSRTGSRRKILVWNFCLWDFSDQLCFGSCKWGASCQLGAPCKPPCL